LSKPLLIPDTDAVDLRSELLGIEAMLSSNINDILLADRSDKSDNILLHELRSASRWSSKQDQLGYIDPSLVSLAGGSLPSRRGSYGPLLPGSYRDKPVMVELISHIDLGAITELVASYQKLLVASKHSGIMRREPCSSSTRMLKLKDMAIIVELSHGVS
jgi:hypothetical protein